MVDTVKTIGVGGDYLTLTAWHSAHKDLNDGNRQVGELLHSIDVGQFLRFDGSWPNGGLLRGSIPVNGVKGQGCVITNTGDATRTFLETPIGFEFQDLELIRPSGYAIQNLEGSVFTRCIIDQSILISANNSPTFNYCVIDSNIDYVGTSSPDIPKVTLNNCILTNRVIARAEVDVDVFNSVSLASDSFLIYSGNTVNISNSFFRQLADGDKTGTITNVTAPYYEPSDFVDLYGGDYRLMADSAPALSGAGAFIEESDSVGVGVFPTVSSFTSQVLNPSINIFNDINIEEGQTYTSYSVVSPDISIGFDISLSPNSALYNTIVNSPVIVQEVDTNILDSGYHFLSDVFSPAISINNDINLDDTTTPNSSNVYNPLVDVEIGVYIPATFPTHYSTTFNPYIVVQEDSELYEDSISFSSNSYKPDITIGTDLNVTSLTATVNSVVYKDSIILDTSVEDRVVNNICTLHSPEINILEDIYVVSEANDNIFNTYRDTITIGITPYISSYTLSYRKLNTRASYRNLNYSIKYRNK